MVEALEPVLPCGSTLKPCALIVLALDRVIPARLASSARLTSSGSRIPPFSVHISARALSIASCRSLRSCWFIHPLLAGILAYSNLGRRRGAAAIFVRRGLAQLIRLDMAKIGRH